MKIFCFQGQLWHSKRRKFLSSNLLISSPKIIYHDFSISAHEFGQRTTGYGTSVRTYLLWTSYPKKTNLILWYANGGLKYMCIVIFFHFQQIDILKESPWYTIIQQYMSRLRYNRFSRSKMQYWFFFSLKKPDNSSCSFFPFNLVLFDFTRKPLHTFPIFCS